MTEPGPTDFDFPFTRDPIPICPRCSMLQTQLEVSVRRLEKYARDYRVLARWFGACVFVCVFNLAGLAVMWLR